MKKYLFKNFTRSLNYIGLFFCCLSILSCQGESESYEVNSDVVANIQEGILEGNLTENYTLNPNVLYKLEGAFVVTSGVTLTIPAGTKIQAHKGGSNIFIAVLQGGIINVDGTSDNPVIMSTEDGLAGGWGGLSIFGNAPSNGVRSISSAFYGGTDEGDNSGTISCLSIVGSGNKLSTDENFNGLSLYGVGSGTTLNNIAIINSLDDGVEFYGGSVSITNLYIENTTDDSIDWTEGWNGSITNSYVSQSINSSTGLEGDFVQIDNNNPEVFEKPTINNLTLVSTDEGNAPTALQFKNNTGASISGLYIDGFDVDVDMLDNGAVSNISIDGITADVTLVSGDSTTAQYTLNSGNKSEQVDISDWTWIRRSL